MTRRALSALLVAVFSVVALSGVMLTTSRAAAVFHELTETGKPGYLALSLDADTPLESRLAPGDSMQWLVEASLRDAGSSTLSFELQAAGDLLESSGMLAEVVACSGAFDVTPAAVLCGGSLETALPASPLSEITQHGNEYQLATLRQGAPRQLLVTLTIPESTPASAIAGQSLRIGLGVHASGDSAAPPASVEPVFTSPTELAVGGADFLALGVLAIGLTGLGLLALLRRRPAASCAGVPNEI